MQAVRKLIVVVMRMSTAAAAYERLYPAVGEGMNLIRKPLSCAYLDQLLTHKIGIPWDLSSSSRVFCQADC
jgi:hypothetical protein